MSTIRTHWYQMPVEDVFARLEASEAGLTTSQAVERLKKYGYNEITSKKPSKLMRFLRQFNSPLIYVLLIAAAITGILTLRGEHMLPDMMVILGVVILNVILGYIQEGKTESALEALRHMIVLEARVLRDGEQKVIRTRELVPGDIVLLGSGDRVPADIRLVSARDVAVDESALTGESTPVEKHTQPVVRPDLPPGDQQCMVFSGTFLTRGSARGVVIATGGATEFGKIAGMVKSTRKVTTPLQRKIADFTKTLMIVIFAIGGLNFLLGYFFGFSFSYSFLATIAMIVAAMPEMLPMLVTSILALSAAAMARQNALIRHLPAAETLGGTTVICSDKTGTLTKNEMTVVKIYSGYKDYSVSGVGYQPAGDFITDTTVVVKLSEHPSLVEALRAGVLCSNATLCSDNGKYGIVGDPTEGALVVVAAKAGINNTGVRHDEIPFESDRMYMATLYPGDEANTLYVKGSPEVVLKMCAYELSDEGTKILEAERILEKAGEMAGNGLRLIAVASRAIAKEKTIIKPAYLEEMVFLGLFGMIDPPREEVIEAISKCKRAGIRIVMITGDHAKTARAIAHQLGIIEKADDTVLTGEELSKISDEELYGIVDRVSVFARVAPEHKLRIARQLQKRGHIVAMTGDGVNDAPALRAADIGISMGTTGTEVSKEASSMILTDDNFASIVAAVEEGRHAWNNLEKAILYTLPTNGGQALLIMAALLISPFVELFHMRLPMEPIHILWVNLFDSVFLTMPLMMEPKEKGLLERPPRRPDARLANSLFFRRVGLVSLVMALIAFFTYWEFGHHAMANADVILSQAQTAALMSVVLVHLGYVFTARSTTMSAFSFSPFTNRWLLAGIAITIVTNLMLVYLPPLNAAFRTAPFPAHWWLMVLVGLPAGFFLPELEKLISRRIARRRAMKWQDK